LRSDLFKYNVIDNPFCPACGNSFETLQHYFIECATYHDYRLVLFADIQHALDSVVSESDLSNLNLLVMQQYWKLS